MKGDEEDIFRSSGPMTPRHNGDQLGKAIKIQQEISMESQSREDYENLIEISKFVYKIEQDYKELLQSSSLNPIDRIKKQHKYCGDRVISKEDYEKIHKEHNDLIRQDYKDLQLLIENNSTAYNEYQQRLVSLSTIAREALDAKELVKNTESGYKSVMQELNEYKKRLEKAVLRIESKKRKQ